MSMATPFEPEPASEQQDDQQVVPDDDVIGDESPATEEPADAVLPDDDSVADPEKPGDDADALTSALHSDRPQGLRTPQAGGGLSAAELRSDLGE